MTSALRAAVPVATAHASAYNFLAITDNQMQERVGRFCHPRKSGYCRPARGAWRVVMSL